MASLPAGWEVPPDKHVCGGEGSVKRSYHPLSFPSPTHSWSARVEEGRHLLEGRRRGWSDSI